MSSGYINKLEIVNAECVAGADVKAGEILLCTTPLASGPGRGGENCKDTCSISFLSTTVHQACQSASPVTNELTATIIAMDARGSVVMNNVK